MKPTLVDHVTERLKRAILSGVYPPGTRLPPEREMAANWGVTRGTARSALQRLVQSGLVESRQGSGTRVAEYVESSGPELLPGLAQLAEGENRREMAADLLLIRRHLAMAVFERWIAHSPDPQPLQSAIDAFAEAAHSGADSEVLADADATILEALLRGTSSATLQLMVNPVRKVLAQMPDLRAAMYRDPISNVGGWRALCSVLTAPDGRATEAVRSLMEARDAATLDAL